jgi:hypothetical protein
LFVHRIGGFNNINFEPMKKLNVPSVVIIAMKMLWSGIGIVDGRGKIGGTVASKSRSGAYARIKVTPVNRRTSYQQAARVVLALFSQAFRQLSTAQISAWNNAAANGYTTTNIFGNTIKKTGLGLYTGLNTNLRTVGVAALSDPPPQESVGNMVSIAPTMAEGATTLFLFGTNSAGGNTVDADTELVVLATAPVSRGVSFVSSQLRIIGTVAAAANTNTTNLNSAYVAKFGQPVAGQKIFIAVTAVNTNTGQAGVPLKQSLIVAA